jgi:type IV pilus assembly protein PilW
MVNSRNRQSGLSLIELMVAMLIGLFLILGVTQIFINNQTSYLFQQGQLGNQENGRFAVAMLNQELMRAGYRANLSTTLPADTSLSGCNFLIGSGIAAVSQTSLCIQYQATNKADVSCQGVALAAADKAAITKPYTGTTYDSRPRVVERLAFDASSGSITCTTGTTTQQMISGVKDVRFEYGSGTLAFPQTISAFSTAPGAGLPIIAVRFSVLMQSPGTATIRDGATSISPALSDWNTRYGTTYNDTKSIYQIVQGSTMIRNQMR